ncbi:MAG: tetratricopeptide repeat protein [Gammaproteobacteria bacterium]|nr:tetratricopeptide repeat protein [Gammaproteobacteria bacterium]
MFLLRQLFNELRRRQVFRDAALYIVTAWVALQVADLALPAYGLPENAIRYVWIAVLLGFPLALLFTWRYELTPEGIKRTPPADPDSSRDLSLRLPDYAILAGMLLIVGVGITQLITTFRTFDTGQSVDARQTAIVPVQSNSIAVLPFANLTPNEDNDYFSDGIAEELLHKLTRIENLKVVARTSSFYFKGKKERIQDIAQRLGVRHILEGSVRQFEQRLRITVQLVDAVTSFQLWSKEFDREQGDIFAIQTELAESVVTSLHGALLGEECKDCPAQSASASDEYVAALKTRLDAGSTRSFAAFDHYLRGREANAKRTVESLDRAVVQFRKAIELDDNFAMAYLGLAEAHVFQHHYGSLSPSEYFTKVETLLDRALEIDTLGLAYGLRGVLETDRRNYVSAETAFGRALKLAPGDAIIYIWYGRLLRLLGRHDEALDVGRMSAHLDPFSAVSRVNLASTYEGIGNFSAAVNEYRRALEIDPGLTVAYDSMALLHQYAFGRLDQAAEFFQKSHGLDPDNPRILRWLSGIYMGLGDVIEAERWLHKAMELDPDSPWGELRLAWIDEYRGNEAEALNHLAEAQRKGSITAWGTLAGVLSILQSRRVKSMDAVAAQHYFDSLADRIYDEENIHITGTNVYSALDLGRFLGSTGENALAREVVLAALDYLDSAPRAGTWGHRWADAQAYALLREDQKAIEVLQNAFDQGLLIGESWILKKHPNLSSLSGYRDFLEIVVAVEDAEIGQLSSLQEETVSGP